MINVATKKYKVVGPGRVNNVEPGGEVEIDTENPNGLNVDALLAAGAIEEVGGKSRTTKTDDSKNDDSKTSEGK